MTKQEPYFKIIDYSQIGNPEVLAMLQAFYSRSPMAIDTRLAGLLDAGSDGGPTTEDRIKKALKAYYVDYGHASIGDCGFVTVFIENVSITAAKAFQDTPLYSGQECSTRYLNFATQPFYAGDEDSEDNQEIRDVQERLRSLYLKLLPLAKEYARSKYALEDVISSKVHEDKQAQAYDKTLSAIAFDYCRSVLPAGATTSLSWTGSLRTFNEHLHTLVGNPLKEVRELARSLYHSLLLTYPSSFKAGELVPYSDTAYLAQDRFHEVSFKSNNPYELSVVSSWIPNEDHLSSAVAARQNANTGRGRQVTDNVQYFAIEGLLDYGSYRDLQRHRNGFNLLPKLTTEYGFSKYHWGAFAEMCTDHPEVFAELEDVLDDVSRLDCLSADLNTVYAIPLGYQVPVNLHWSHGQLEYCLRLRSSTSVHPTLREFMWELYKEATNHAPDLSEFWVVDHRTHYSQADRGEQDIKRRD